MHQLIGSIPISHWLLIAIGSASVSLVRSITDAYLILMFIVQSILSAPCGVDLTLFDRVSLRSAIAVCFAVGPASLI